MLLHILIFVATVISTSKATTFAEQPFPDTVQDAPIVVRGKIGMNYTNWVQLPEGGRKIFTFTELQMTDVLKGKIKLKEQIILREFGGEKDGVGMQVPGSAKFERGEEVIVFLNDPVNADGSYQMRGLMMSKLNIIKDNDGSEMIYGPAISGSGSAHDDHDTVKEVSGSNRPEMRKKWSVLDLKALINAQESKSGAVDLSQSNPNVKSSPQVDSQKTPSSAPQLQNNTSAGPTSSFQEMGLGFKILIGVMSIILMIFFFRKK